MNITNRAVAAYMLWIGRDGSPEEIELSYQELRSMFNLPWRELEYRRYIKIQSAMCTDGLVGIVAVLKRVQEEKAPGESQGLIH